MKASLLLLILFFSGEIVLSQDLKPKSVASPEQASLGKFGTTEVGNYTGTPGISIPLYSIALKGISVPIVLQYHPSGVQVEQEATWVGLGWDLSVGGSISHQINGDLDMEEDLSPYALTYNGIKADLAGIGGYPNMEYVYLNQNLCIVWTCIDDYPLSEFQVIKAHNLGIPDVYSVSLPEGSFQFHLEPLTHEPIQFGKRSNEYFIERDSTIGPYESEWTIKDSKGNTYFFSRADNEYSSNYGSSAYYNGFNYKITSITTVSGDVINFTYTNGKYENNTYTASKSFDFHAGTSNLNIPLYTTKFNGKYLTKIETDDIKVIFELSNTQNERQDLKADTIASGYGAKRLNAVHIWDKVNNKLIKSYNFTYGYFGYDAGFSGAFTTVTDAISKRLKLLSVKEIGYDQNGSEITSNPPYTFEYDTAQLLPRKDAYARDHWGYFNGQAGNTSFLPDITNDINSTIAPIKDFFDHTYPDYVINDLKAAGQANKGMNAAFAKSSILNKVTYPTGGKTIFEYEANRFKNYRVFSASEVSSEEGVINGNVVDMNTWGSILSSSHLYPDLSGKLELFDFKASFTRIDHAINSSHFLNARIRVRKIITSGPPIVVGEWYLTTSELPQFELNHTYAFGPYNLVYTGDPTDYYIIEAYLPDITELTPSGSSIPVATAGSIFVVSDYSSKLKESIGAGLRVKSITNRDVANEFVDKKIYKYLLEDTLTTSGKLMAPIKNYSYLNGYTVVGPYSNRVRYQTEMYGISSYSYVPSTSDADGQLVGYDKVEVISVDSSGVDNGKTAYTYFNTPSTILAPAAITFSKPAYNIPYYSNGLLKDEKVFIKNALTPISEKLYSYALLKSETKRYPIIYDLSTGAYTDSFCINNCLHNYTGTFDAPIGKWLSIIYPLNAKWYATDTITYIGYSQIPSGQITMRTSFKYNSFGQVIEEKSVTSKGDTMKTLSTYPIDVASPSSLVQLMKTKKMYHLLLNKQEILTKPGVTKTLSNTDYAYLQTSSANINVSQVQKSIGTGAAFDLATNISYDDKDNVVQFNKNGMVSSYVWDYFKTLIIAEVTNADTTSIAYTSFEADGKGGWTYGGSASNAYSITGDKSYLTSAGNITKSGLTSTAYIVSYWGRGGSVNVNSTGPTRTGKSIGNWTYYEHDVTGTSITVSGSNYIDELQLYPKAAQMKTYTYSPLIGITSQSDVGGHITYYEYDDFNRLKLVKDEDGRILKRMDYKYQGTFQQ